jgi:hypothetical protein
MMENILMTLQQLGVITLVAVAVTIFFLFRHLIKQAAHEHAIKRSQDALDRLAKAIAYAQLAADRSVVSRKHLRNTWQIRRDFRALVKQRLLYCEQSASTKEWNDHADLCLSKAKALTEVIDLATDEIYWAKMAKKAHKQAKLALEEMKSAEGPKLDLSRAESNFARAHSLLAQRQYLKSWEQSRFINPLIELCTEESKLHELICSLDASKCSFPGDAEFIDAVKLSLDSLPAHELMDHSQLEDLRRRLKTNRIKLEILASATPQEKESKSQAE